MRLGLALGVLLLSAGAAEAASCSVSDASLSLGVIDPAAGAAVPSSGIINVTCSLGAAYAVGLNNGANASGGVRRLKHGSSSSYLAYELYKTPLLSARFGDAVVSERASEIGLGIAANPVAVYATVPSGQTAPAGSYGDQVRITVYF